MNLVWPVTALYFSIFGLWGYFRAGRKMTKAAIAGRREHEHMKMTHQARSAPTFTQAAISDSHCGAGCTLGDIIAEFSLFGLGWTLLGKTLFAEYAGRQHENDVRCHARYVTSDEGNVHGNG